MPIAATRAIVRAALSGELDDAPTRTDPIFGFEVPLEVPGVDSAPARPPRHLGRRRGLRRVGDDLAAKFSANFEPYAEGVTDAIAAAGPRAAAGRS